jgi:hypothetical protein
VDAPELSALGFAGCRSHVKVFVVVTAALTALIPLRIGTGISRKAQQVQEVFLLHQNGLSVLTDCRADFPF